MSRTSIAKAPLRTAVTADTVEIAETVAGAGVVRVVVGVDVVAVAAAEAVVDVTAVAMADTVEDGTKRFATDPHRFRRIKKLGKEGCDPSVAAFFFSTEGVLRHRTPPSGAVNAPETVHVICYQIALFFIYPLSSIFCPASVRLYSTDVVKRRVFTSPIAPCFMGVTRSS